MAKLHCVGPGMGGIGALLGCLHGAPWGAGMCQPRAERSRDVHAGEDAAATGCSFLMPAPLVSCWQVPFPREVLFIPAQLGSWGCEQDLLYQNGQNFSSLAEPCQCRERSRNRGLVPTRLSGVQHGAQHFWGDGSTRGLGWVQHLCSRWRWQGTGRQFVVAPESSHLPSSAWLGCCLNLSFLGPHTPIPFSFCFFFSPPNPGQAF